MKKDVKRALYAWGFTAAFIAAVGTAAWHYPPPTPQLGPASVKVELDDGHGSGVHIGGNRYLTATHVVERGAFKIRARSGKESPASILWTSKGHDVAMAEAADDLGLRAASLACEPQKVGTRVRIVGNPQRYDAVTSFGAIAAPVSVDTPWQAVVLLDATALPGMSGGPVFDALGRVIGLLVGLVQSLAHAPFPIGTATGFSFMVPATAICKMLGRGNETAFGVRHSQD